MQKQVNQGVEIISITNFFESRSGIGESIFYRPSDSTLHFVDIRRHLLHRLALTTNAQGTLSWTDHSVIGTQDAIGVAVELAGSLRNLVVGAKYGFAVIDTVTGKMEYIAKTYANDEEAQSFRMNDGAVDSRGRLWAGTMQDGSILDSPKNRHHQGSLFRFDPSGHISVHIDGTCGVPNGLGWSPDDKIMYWTDSVDATIYNFDFLVEEGTISNRRLLITFTETLARKTTEVPDGLCVDTEGCVWTAMYEGGRVLRLSPDGEILMQINVPAWRVSCPCFGGSHMDELFLASIELDAEDKENRMKYGQDGNVLCVKLAGLKGLPKHRFGQVGGLDQQLFSV